MGVLFVTLVLVTWSDDSYSEAHMCFNNWKKVKGNVLLQKRNVLLAGTYTTSSGQVTVFMAFANSLCKRYMQMK